MGISKYPRTNNSAWFRCHPHDTSMKRIRKPTKAKGWNLWYNSECFIAQNARWQVPICWKMSVAWWDCFSKSIRTQIYGGLQWLHSSNVGPVTLRMRGETFFLVLRIFPTTYFKMQLYDGEGKSRDIEGPKEHKEWTWVEKTLVIFSFILFNRDAKSRSR